MGLGLGLGPGLGMELELQLELRETETRVGAHRHLIGERRSASHCGLSAVVSDTLAWGITLFLMKYVS